MKIYKTYIDIEEILYTKVKEMVKEDCREDFGLYIMGSSGEYIDTIYFGLRDLFFNSNWLIIGNDICNDDIEFDINHIKVVNPIHIVEDEYKEEVKRVIKNFVLQYGLKDKSKNCYTFDEPF